MDGVTSCIDYAASVDNKLRIAVPGGGILPAPFPPGVCIARTEKLLTGYHQARVWECALRISIQQYLCCILGMSTSVFISLRGCRHKLCNSSGFCLISFGLAIILGV